MAEQQRDKIEYEFEDLRRNSDPVSNLVLAQLGIEASDETDDERHEGRNRREARSGRDDDDDGHDVDDDEEVTLSRKELSRRLIRERQKAERNATRAIEAAKEEAAEVIGKLEKRLDGIERKGKTEEIDQEFATKRADLEAKIEAAMEKGESKQVTALTIELSELIADHRIKRAESSRRVTDDSPDDRGQDADRGDKPRKGMIPRAREWVEQQDWFESAGYDEERRYLNRLDAELQRRGYRPTDDDYYELLEEKLDERFPGLITRTMREDGEDDEDDEEDDEEFGGDRRSQRRRSEFDDIPDKRRSSRERQRRASRRAPVNSGGRDASRRDPDRGSRRQKTLSRSQVANMRAFGMDPDNKEHVEAYLAGV